MKRMRVDRATAAVSGKEFGEGSVEVIGDERGDDILFTVGDNKEVTGASGIEVVLPSRTWVHSWLGTVGAWSLPFYVSVHCFSFQYISLGLLV